MTFSIDAGTIALAVSVLSGLATIYGFFVKVAGVAVELGKLQLKTDTVWDVVIKSATSAAFQQHILQHGSPIYLNGAVAQQFGELGERIRESYKNGHMERLTDNEVILILAHRFGNELMERFGNDMNFGAALVAALHVAKGETT